MGEPWSLFDLCKPSASMCAPPPGEKTGGKVNIGRYGSVTWIEMQPNQLLCIVCRVEGRSIENTSCGSTSWVDYGPDAGERATGMIKWFLSSPHLTPCTLSFTSEFATLSATLPKHACGNISSSDWGCPGATAFDRDSKFRRHDSTAFGRTSDWQNR